MNMENKKSLISLTEERDYLLKFKNLFWNEPFISKGVFSKVFNGILFDCTFYKTYISFTGESWFKRLIMKVLDERLQEIDNQIKQIQC